MQRPATNVCLFLNTDLDSYSRLCNDKGGREVCNKKGLALSWHLAQYMTPVRLAQVQEQPLQLRPHLDSELAHTTM
jgi:hypothetical protein